jgi:hypothetical protein
MGDVWAAIGASVAALSVIGVLVRISYQLGGLVTEFRQYRMSNDLVVSKLDERLAFQERRRR